jgi:hypothetical protein
MNPFMPAVLWLVCAFQLVHPPVTVTKIILRHDPNSVKKKTFYKLIPENGEYCGKEKIISQYSCLILYDLPLREACQSVIFILLSLLGDERLKTQKAR